MNWLPCILAALVTYCAIKFVFDAIMAVVMKGESHSFYAYALIISIGITAGLW